MAKRLKKEKVNVDIINFGEEVTLKSCFDTESLDYIVIDSLNICCL